MGTCCALGYADLYVVEWERTIFEGDDPSMYLCHVMWHRYIDDIFVLWDGPNDLLHGFLAALSQNEFDLKFTMLSNLSKNHLFGC